MNESITIGRDLTVHRMGFGAMRLCGPRVMGYPADRNAALAVLRHAVERGVTLVDTADAYGPAVNEEQIAEALHPYPAELSSRPKAETNARAAVGFPAAVPSIFGRHVKRVYGACGWSGSISISCTHPIRRCHSPNPSVRSKSCAMRERSGMSASRTCRSPNSTKRGRSYRSFRYRIVTTSAPAIPTTSWTSANATVSRFSRTFRSTPATSRRPVGRWARPLANGARRRRKSRSPGYSNAHPRSYRSPVRRCSRISMKNLAAAAIELDDAEFAKAA